MYKYFVKSSTSFCPRENSFGYDCSVSLAHWFHLALAINLARVRRCSRACVTAWCNVVVGVLVDYRLSSTISAPEVLVRPHIEMTVVDRMGELTVFYVSDGHERAREFRLGARLGAFVVVRDGIRLIHIFAVLSMQILCTSFRSSISIEIWSPSIFIK